MTIFNGPHPTAQSRTFSRFKARIKDIGASVVASHWLELVNEDVDVEYLFSQHKSQSEILIYMLRLLGSKLQDKQKIESVVLTYAQDNFV